MAAVWAWHICVNAIICLSLSQSTVAGNAESLYSANENIVILNSDSFNGTVFNKRYAHLVEFYSSWCGHCIRYAPTYKQIAVDILDWRPVVTVAAVNCAEEQNTDVCREHDINMYPTLKWFPAHSISGASAVQLEEYETAVTARHSVISLMESNYDIKNASTANQRIRNHLLPLNKSEDIMKFVSSDTKFMAIVVEPVESFVGREVILDLLLQRELVVRRLIDPVFTKPVLHLVRTSDGASGLQPVLEPEERREIVLHLLSVLRPASSTALKESASEAAATMKNRLSRRRDTLLYEKDLESSLQYSLLHEVALSNSIEGERLNALSAYVKTLVKFLPVRGPVLRFLEQLHKWLSTQQKVSGTDWSTQINNLQTNDMSVFRGNVEWAGCQGSQSRYRGYPCSLWMTFHTLVASAAKRRDTEMDGRQVLLNIRGYVKNFFGCRECRQNFMKGAVHIEERVHSDDDAVLFLWRSHNKANFRLHGDATEDPDHPKVQFPDARQCAPCHTTSANGTDAFNEREVLRFLLTMYDSGNIVTDVTSRGYTPAPVKAADSTMKGITAIIKSLIGRRDQIESYLSFTDLDINLCFAFYFVCILFIGAIYCKFCKRNRLNRVNKFHLQV